MHPVARAVISAHLDAPSHAPPSYAREDLDVPQPTTTYRNYRLGVVAAPEARLALFTAFVRRALDRAKTTRGWSVERVAEEAGVSANTIYLWRSGTAWKKFPLAENVEAFCDALAIKPELAFGILWPGRDAKPAEPEPLGPEPDLITLARRLADPSVSREEKYLIRETIRGLASRSAQRDDRRRGTG